MSAPGPAIVLKFGSSVLRSEDDLPVAVHEIYRWRRLGYRVVAVVSAFAGITDSLVADSNTAAGWPAERLREAAGSDVAMARREATGRPLQRPDSASAGMNGGMRTNIAETVSIAGSGASALAMLLAAGERRTAALLAIELETAGVPVQVLDPAGVGLTTRSSGLETDPARVDCRRIERALDTCPVAVLPGFQAVDGRGVATLLGRGGSDMTAVFVAHRLGARCRLLKDVPGVFENRPPSPTGPLEAAALPGGRTIPDLGSARPAGTPAATGEMRTAASDFAFHPHLFASLSWAEAAAVGNGVVQHRSLAFAEREGFSLEVAAPAQAFATRIGEGPAVLVPHRDTPPLKVAILGLGTVGRAVYRRLLALPHYFRVVAVAVRDPARHHGGDVPPELLSDDPWRVLERPADVVVEALPGAEPACALLERALTLGRDVVTANKAALTAAPWLFSTEPAAGRMLRASAAVGGAVPALETASRLAADGGLAAIHGVLNGTSNFVLDRVEAGETFEAAVSEARRRGLAEADPTADLDGSDVARKLVLLAHAAFGVILPLNSVRRRGIESFDQARVRAAAAAGKRLRLVGSLTFRRGCVDATVRPLVLPGGHFLAGARDEENRVIFELRGSRPVRLAGKGAGGRPTAEAVVADLLDLWRLRRAAESTAMAEPVSTGPAAASSYLAVQAEEVGR